MRRPTAALGGMILGSLLVVTSACQTKPEARHVQPEAELKYKQAVVEQDVAVTDQLCRNQCLLHVNRMYASLNQADPKKIKETMREMQSKHEHIIMLNWVPAKAGSGISSSAGTPASPGATSVPSGHSAGAAGSSGSSTKTGSGTSGGSGTTGALETPGSASSGEIVSGKLSRELAKIAQPFIEEAKKAAAQGNAYQSPNFTAADKPYFVLNVPAPDKKSSVVAVVRQHILQEVSNHQRKNLRLQSFHSDKNRWKIESVDTGTLRSKRVTHPEDHEGTSHYERHDVVVQFNRPLRDAELSRIRTEIGATKVKLIGNTYIITARSLEARQLMDYFRKRQDVRFVEPHYIYETNDLSRGVKPLNWFFDWWPGSRSGNSGTQRSEAEEQAAAQPDVIPNDVLFNKYQWNLPITNTLRGWNFNKGTQDVTVAIVDTGADVNHEDLKGQLVEGYNVLDPAAQPMDDVGHGTHVAGIIGAQVNNGLGVAGMTWYNKIMPVKALDSSGVGSTYAVAQGIIWATDHGAKVINLSLGNYASSDFLHDAIKYAYDRDVVLIAASGNDNTERPGYPAAYPEVFAVAATDSGNERASFSNYGDYIDVAAPGVSIASTYPQNQYAALSGTSMACPHVTALAALLRSANPSLKNTEVMELMRQTASDIGDKGRDTFFGFGLINVDKAVEAALGRGPAQAGLPGAAPVPAAP
ncbi:S8 family peptidase [Paenibacillus sp. UNC499MF]|uniref:S8 family peptidase n=1 Tax=Paenibacillus sp. UNC499MF TaxID=1502751 RepID=UPI00089F9C76|nr:S8 family peptidase [Paenibacillus sp. UNC499MF]SEF50490.1 Subtilase family protein [Paenibacillus sp. UNC499MF]